MPSAPLAAKPSGARSRRPGSPAPAGASLLFAAAIRQTGARPAAALDAVTPNSSSGRRDTTVPTPDPASASPQTRRPWHYSVALALALPVFAACGGPQLRTTVSLQEIDSQASGAQAREALRKTPGVDEATFDRRRAELVVDHDPTQISPKGVVDRVSALGYRATLGAGKGGYVPQREGYPEGADVRELGGGDGVDFDLAATASATRPTVIDFWAPWCGPCRSVGKHLQLRLQQGGNFALRKVDIVDWDSPLAAHHLAGIPSLPYVLVLAPGGAKVAAIVGLDLDAIDAALARAQGARDAAVPPENTP